MQDHATALIVDAPGVAPYLSSRQGAIDDCGIQPPILDGGDPSVASPYARPGHTIPPMASNKGPTHPHSPPDGVPAPYQPPPLHVAWTLLKGRITLARTIDVFEASPLIERIILVLDPVYIADAEMLRRSEGWYKIAAIVPNSPSRQASVYRGLDALAALTSSSNWVIVHDAVRPLVTPVLLEEGLQAAQQYQAATAAVPVKETIKQVEQGKITATLDRSQLWTVQTPQVFSYPLLHKAHRQARVQHLHDSSDDAALLEQLREPVAIFPGSYTNIKILTAEDLLLAEALLEGSV